MSEARTARASRRSAGSGGERADARAHASYSSPAAAFAGASMGASDFTAFTPEYGLTDAVYGDHLTS
jgi:hypothetical protein